MDSLRINQKVTIAKLYKLNYDNLNKRMYEANHFKCFETFHARRNIDSVQFFWTPYIFKTTKIYR